MYTVGQKVRLSVTFTVGGLVEDPSAVTFKILNPAGTITTYTYVGDPTILVRESKGLYHVDHLLTLAGPYAYRFAGVGVCDAAAETTIEVAYSPF